MVPSSRAALTRWPPPSTGGPPRSRRSSPKRETDRFPPLAGVSSPAAPRERMSRTSPTSPPVRRGPAGLRLPRASGVGLLADQPGVRAATAPDHSGDNRLTPPRPDAVAARFLRQIHFVVYTAEMDPVVAAHGTRQWSGAANPIRNPPHREDAPRTGRGEPSRPENPTVSRRHHRQPVPSSHNPIPLPSTPR